MNPSSPTRNKDSRNLKLTIEYDGTNFNGWQTQSLPKKPGKAPIRTVQNEIENALKKIFKERIILTGSGRTDSGVHAVSQVANFQTGSTMPFTRIQKALNANLPEDIVILNVEGVPLDFHARYSIKSKTYRYTILNRDTRCAKDRHFCLLYPYKLNVTAMREEATALMGRHDFKSFTASDPAKRKKGIKENTIRTIKRLTINKKDDFITIDIEANGFLYKMVRNIVGTLLEAGTGKLPPGSVKRILSRKDRTLASATAKPLGLALLKVKY